MLEILNNDYIRNNLRMIAETEKESSMTVHSLQHAFKVSNFCKELCDLLSLSDRYVLHAAIVHDIGMVGGKEGHALRSYEMLKENTDLDERILLAVKYHSFLEEIPNYEAAVLAICDKIDIDKSRLLPKGLEDDFHSRLCKNIERTSMFVDDEKVVINYETSGEVEIKLYEKLFMILERAFDYLGVGYDVRLDNVSVL